MTVCAIWQGAFELVRCFQFLFVQKRMSRLQILGPFVSHFLLVGHQRTPKVVARKKVEPVHDHCDLQGTVPQSSFKFAEK